MPPGPDPEQQPLLASDRARLLPHENNSDIIDCHIRKLHGDETPVLHLRQRLQAFFASKWGHYFVIILVALDIAGIFADFLIQLHVKEHTCKDVPEEGFDVRSWKRALEVLSIFSLIFSSLFMLELVGSFFAFGPR
jgi:voltage-gated hydrogen channel 1